MQLALIAKILLNVHDLSNERAEEIRRIPLIVERGGFEVVEDVVAVTGMILKRYHAAHLVDLAESSGAPLCPVCKRKEGVRLPPIIGLSSKKSEESRSQVRAWLQLEEREFDDYLKRLQGSESELIETCVIEDAHGFLRAEERVASMLRRESLVKFSWMLPASVLPERYPTPFRVVTHSRNIREVPVEEQAPRQLREQQMPFPRSYASGIYGFTSLADLKFIGFSLSERRSSLDDNERKLRRRLVIKAYTPLLTGACGASLARSLPASKPLEVIAIVTPDEHAILPAPAHPMYENHYDLNIKLYRDVSKLFDATVKVIAWGVGEEERDGKFEVIAAESPADVLNKAKEALGL